MIAERGLTAAVLAHEIRNPLAALRFQIHSLRKTSDTDRISQTADTIDSELLRIQAARLPTTSNTKRPPPSAASPSISTPRAAICRCS